MCGRYYISDENTAGELTQMLESLQSFPADASVKTHGEIFPSDIVPVIANNKRLKPSLFPMKWGYTLTDGKLLINARSETASFKSLFRDGMQQRRCLVPAACYFEWQQQDKDKIKFAIKPRAFSTMYMAGIYRMEENQAVFIILTREPAPEICHIHSRMPIILSPEAAVDWLNLDHQADDILQSAMDSLVYEPDIYQ